jgi:hypothetical protein
MPILNNKPLDIISHPLTATVLCLIFLSGCSTPLVAKNHQKENSELVVLCKSPRPQICTMIYNPVCAYQGEKTKTYASDCSACADSSVSGYTLGECLSEQ